MAIDRMHSLAAGAFCLLRALSVSSSWRSYKPLAFGVSCVTLIKVPFSRMALFLFLLFPFNDIRLFLRGGRNSSCCFENGPRPSRVCLYFCLCMCACFREREEIYSHRTKSRSRGAVGLLRTSSIFASACFHLYPRAATK